MWLIVSHRPSRPLTRAQKPTQHGATARRGEGRRGRASARPHSRTRVASWRVWMERNTGRDVMLMLVVRRIQQNEPLIIISLILLNAAFTTIGIYYDGHGQH